MKEKNQSRFRNLIAKTLSDPNLFKILPVLLLPTIIIFLCGLFLLNYLPVEIKDAVGLNNFGSVFIAGIILFAVWFFYRNSLVFRISICVVLLVAVTTFMNRMNEFMGGIAVKDSIGEFLIQSVPSGFFIGVMVAYIVLMLRIPITRLVSSVEKVSEGELVGKQSDLEVYGSEFGQFENSFIKMVENMAMIIKAAQSSIEQVAATSEELAATSREVSALTEEVTSTVQQISQGAARQSEIAGRSITEVQSMSDNIDRSLTDITAILQVIEEIAAQTNILALNAAIEAARAGESGRGFAVVADNVRRLAEETQKNSGDIKKVTDEIVNNLSKNVRSLDESLQGFATQSEEFSASSEEVAAASEEQSASMQQLTNSAEDLSKLSEDLSLVISRFKT